MNAILVVIARVFADQTVKVFFVHRDDMVEDLAATASNPSFCGSVLPWRLNASPLWLQSSAFKKAITSALKIES